MIFEIYVTILTFDTDIFNALSNSDDFNIEPETWDLTPEKLNSDLYLRHIFFNIEKENENIFKLIWRLKTNENIENKEIVYEGIVKQLDMLESSLNTEYHLIDSNLIDPKTSLEITSVLVNSKPAKSDSFNEFNSRNNEIKQKLLGNSGY